MRYCIADLDLDVCRLVSLWASASHICSPHLFLVLIDRSLCPVEIYDSGVLVCRSATYQGV